MGLLQKASVFCKFCVRLAAAHLMKTSLLGAAKFSSLKEVKMLY